MGNAADAEDLVQDAYLRAYRGLPSSRGASRFSTWLYRIAVNILETEIQRLGSS